MQDDEVPRLLAQHLAEQGLVMRTRSSIRSHDLPAEHAAETVGQGVEAGIAVGPRLERPAAARQLVQADLLHIDTATFGDPLQHCGVVVGIGVADVEDAEGLPHLRGDMLVQPFLASTEPRPCLVQMVAEAGVFVVPPFCIQPHRRIDGRGLLRGGITVDVRQHSLEHRAVQVCPKRAVCLPEGAVVACEQTVEEEAVGMHVRPLALHLEDAVEVPQHGHACLGAEAVVA